MIRFENDYSEGVHEQILNRLIETNQEQTTGYGTDEYCEKARFYIKKACQAEHADVHFLVGGTQTNTTLIASILRPYQGVISATTGHIATMETGAIEATGHKILTLPSDNGKITASQVKELCSAHLESPAAIHTVQPGLVYISNPTENGTNYTKAELEELSQVCGHFNIPLMMDGARLGYALAAPNNDLSLPDIARFCDVFYIGGTKIGALFGEAAVITNDNLKKDFRYMIKQKGGMLAKGRLLGIQFETLFKENLYEDISNHAVELAMKIREGFIQKGFKLRYDSMSNQQFPILPQEALEKLNEKYSFAFWEKLDSSHTVVRICTSWATKKEHVEELVADIMKL